MDKMKIEIWSDIACPYCYIGKKKLEKAIEQFGHKDEIELVWHSYELDPTLPKKALGVSSSQYFAQKYEMPIQEAEEHEQSISEIAKEIGLNYDYNKLIVTNTSSALRLVKLAAKSNLATEAEEVLFAAYFEQGKNISDRATLVELGEKIGLKASDINNMLDSNNFDEAVKNDTKHADEELKLEYIPFYRLNNNQIIQGSIDVKDYYRTVKAAYSDWKSGTLSEGEIITGQSCSIDGVCS